MGTTIKDRFLCAESVTRSEAGRNRFPKGMSAYRRKAARDYFERFPETLKRVTFVEPAQNRTGLQYAVMPYEILHCMSSSGKYGKPMKLIFGVKVEVERKAVHAREEAEWRERINKENDWSFE